MHEVGAAIHGSGNWGLGVNRAKSRQQWQQHFRGEAATGLQPVSPVQKAENATIARRPGVAGERTDGRMRLRIEELALRGIGSMDGRTIADALESELYKKIVAGGVPENWQKDLSVENAETMPLRLISQTNARWTGEQLARAIYNLCGKGTR